MAPVRMAETRLEPRLDREERVHERETRLDALAEAAHDIAVDRLVETVVDRVLPPPLPQAAHLLGALEPPKNARAPWLTPARLALVAHEQPSLLTNAVTDRSPRRRWSGRS